jgi:hypothetical protein
MHSPFADKSGLTGLHRCDAWASPTCWPALLVCRRSGRTKAHKSPSKTVALPLPEYSQWVSSVPESS